MPVKTCLSNILSTRFEFGVPLEDVFPPNDIHPRLTYLFGKAHESYIKHGYNIENILGNEQGSVKERLKLKEKLVLDLDYHINVEEFCTGTYFWVIRHFLGLLPLPLLPSYTKGIQFDWNSLADESKRFLQNHGDAKRDKHLLDYDIAQTINMLPFENFVLLNVLIAFMRRLSIKNIKGRQLFNRKSMMFLSKYYCSSMFVRPFRPGYYLKNNCYLPLLLYLILRWQKISNHCEAVGNPAYFLECDFKNIEYYKNFGQRDNCTQTNILRNAFFNPEVISVCKNIPYFVNICNTYLKDIGCQTDTDLCREKCSGSCSPILEESEKSVVNLDDEKNDVNKTDTNDHNNPYKLAYIEEETTNVSENDDARNDNDNTLYQTATDISFNSILNKEERRDWQNIVKEIMDTVKKVEESYIYDDYETFKKEDFNQIGKNRSRSFLSKISKYGFTYTPPRNTARHDIKKTSTPEKISPDSESSYIKYPDVCEDRDIEDHRNFNCDNHPENSESTKINISDDYLAKIKPKGSVSQKLFQDDTPRSVQDDNSKQNLNGGNVKKRKKYVIKRIRLTLEFLRTLTPKKSTFKKFESRVKYFRIKNGRSNTF